MRASTILMSLPMALVLLAPVHAQEVRTGADAFGTWEGGRRPRCTPSHQAP
jgi:hypothetical protein